MKFNKAFISNSLVLLEKPLKYAKYISLLSKLHQKKYKYVLSVGYENNLIAFMKKHEISNLLNEEKELIKIADGYGFLDDIKRYYDNKFRVLFPKRVLPTKTFFDKNIEKLFDMLKKWV